MQKGTVKWYKSGLGLGFICNDADGRDIFVYHSCVTAGCRLPLRKGQRVSFDIEADPHNANRPRAVNVSLA